MNNFLKWNLYSIRCDGAILNFLSHWKIPLDVIAWQFSKFLKYYYLLFSFIYTVLTWYSAHRNIKTESNGRKFEKDFITFKTYVLWTSHFAQISLHRHFYEMDKRIKQSRRMIHVNGICGNYSKPIIPHDWFTLSASRSIILKPLLIFSFLQSSPFNTPKYLHRCYLCFDFFWGLNYQPKAYIHGSFDFLSFDN